MNRRRALAGIAAALLAAHARGAGKPKRVVFVPTAGAAREHQRLEGARERMVEWAEKVFSENGLVPGRDLAVEYVDLQLADLDLPAIEARAKALLARGPDLVLVGEDGIEVLARLTRIIPLVFYQFSGDPIVFGLVRSFNHPGGNVTGSTLAPPGAEIKGWELLRDLAPKARRLGVLWRKEDLGDPWAALELERQRAGAERLGFEWVQVVFARTPTLGPIERAIRAARVEALDANAELEDPWVKDLMRFVERSKLPTLWANQGRVRDGGLAAVHGSYGESMNEAIAIASRILRGAKPADIPVASPRRFVTAINQRTARAMGLEVPPAVRVRATIVVE
jgi:putative ABC transport system substrate-binding protein